MCRKAFAKRTIHTLVGKRHIQIQNPAKCGNSSGKFELLPNDIFIESKGWFLPEDRKKHLLIKEQNPDMDLRFVLQSPNGKIYKGSKTTYAQWCEKNGFKWAKKEIPQEWIDEKPITNFFG